MRWLGIPSVRKSFSVVGVVSLVALMAACGGGNASSGSSGAASGALGPKNSVVACPSSTATTAASPESGNITLVVSTWGADKSEINLDQQGFNSFMQKYPNIKIDYQPIPSNYDQKMQANVASGNVPDVFYVDQNMAQTYVPAGKLLNLSPYLQRDNINPSAYYPQLMHDFDCANGSVFGIPKDFGTLGLVYNKTLFQQAGLAAPDASWTWTDVQNAAQKLTGIKGPNGKVYGIATSADPARWMAFMYAAGGSVLSSDGKSATFNSSAGVQSATWWSSFRSAGTGVLPGDVGAGWNGDAFGNQRVAMTFEGGWMIPFMTESFPNVQYGIAPMPKAPNGKASNLLFTNAWGAYAGTKHADAAAKLVEWMTNQSFESQVLQAGFALPTIQSLVTSQASWLNQSTQLNQNVKQLLLNAQGGHSWFYGPAQTEVVNDTTTALQAIMLNHANVKTSLDQAGQKVDTWIQQNGS